ncbi:hypothetical protein MLD38_016599 [Melastoma candidum]|uniref:Uncharacterized protein n=1 Tax=Melastoma candidum TaxID=119954 RepID=A0ACB9QN19_9MYRT|nr:hypothetical protein MLD38_016599 [Melastoma candidum]
MVFSRLADAIPLLKGRVPAMRYPPTSGLPPLPAAPAYGSGYGNAGPKNSLRHASSLQDLSAYRGLFVEDSDLDGLTSKPPHPLLRNNVGDSFSKEKAISSRTPFVKRKCLRVALTVLFLLLLAVLIYMVSLYIYSNWSRGTSKFYVVLDCGSTGTRVYVYKASLHHRNDGSLPIIIKSLNEGINQKPKLQSGRAYDRMETEPGFDKLVHNKSGLKSAINPLLLWAQKQIPKHSHETTSLFLYATAGVRRLPDADSKWLLDNAWSILRKSPFMCERDSVRIISGTEEAYYGWAALNYRTGMFGAIPKKETFGALDLGGSSLQVTFENREGVQNATGLKLRIGGNNHDLNAYSLSGYGLNDAFDKSVTLLVSDLPKGASTDLANGKLELKHPCLLSGYKEQYVCNHCTSSDRESGSPVIGDGKLVKGKAGVPLWLVGAPNWEQCSALAKGAVNLSEWSQTSLGFDCDVQPCALPENLPRPHGHFYAMSGFFVVYRFFNLTSDATLDDVLEKGRAFCEKTWEAAKKSVAPQPFIEQYCFRAPYITLLLREGLHITEKQITIGSGGITWTLGVALLEAGKSFPTRLGIPSYEKLQAKINPVILIAGLVISLLLLLCALSCVCKCMPRFFRRSYLPLSRHSSTSALSVPSPFRFQRWSPISLGEHRTKMPLSPTVAGSREGPFSFGHSVGSSSIQLESLYPSTSGVTPSFSSSSLGQMPFDNGGMGSFWNPHRGQMRLQSRRSQSREDLNSSISEAHLVKM